MYTAVAQIMDDGRFYPAKIPAYHPISWERRIVRAAGACLLQRFQEFQQRGTVLPVQAAIEIL